MSRTDTPPAREARGHLRAVDIVSRLALRQHGVVSRAQLLDAGLRLHAIDNLLKRRWMRVVHRGVYEVSLVRDALAPEMAAVLVCGERGFLGFRSAGQLWTFVLSPAGDVHVEVIVVRGDRPRVPGILARRITGIRPDEITSHRGIPVTTPARTLLDLAAVAGRREMERWLARAEGMELVEGKDVLALIERHPGRTGIPLLRALLGAGASPKVTRSEAEQRLLGMVRAAGLPEPATNVRVSGFEVDFLWRKERLIVEVDGFEFHRSRRAFERDRQRDAVLVAAGFRVLRVTWRQLTRKRDATLTGIAQALVR